MFFHAHCHSEYSLQDAILRVKEGVDRAQQFSQEALALTDHGTMAGLVEHYQACRAKGIVPILGVEGYLVRDSAAHPQLVKYITERLNLEGREAVKGTQESRKQATNSAAQASRQRRHVLLLARDHVGYQMLARAMSKAYGQMYFKPLFDHSDLESLAEGGHVWLTTGCPNGEIPHLYREGKIEAAQNRMEWYARLYRDRFAVELMHHQLGDVDEAGLNAFLLGEADRLGLPCFASQDVHYLEESDREIHDFFKRIAYKATLTQQAAFDGDGYHFCAEEHLRSRFPDEWSRLREGYQTIFDSAKDVTFPALDSYSYAVPQITPKNPVSVLMSLTRGALEKEIAAHPQQAAEYAERWQHELGVIRDTGFAQYFLFVRLVVRFCERQDIFCVARGSASGSLVCYLLGITQVNPLEYGLLFERFLSNDRSKPPDIDLDVQDDRRDEVISFVSHRFNTTQIGTVSTYADRSAKNEVLAQLVRDQRVPENAEVDQLEELEPEGFRALQRLTGLKRQSGGHPAGVIAETDARSVADLVPLMFISSSKRWVTQYGMDDIEALGFVKLDVLGVRSLRTVRVCLDLLGEKSWDHIPFDDKETYRLLSSGQTEGVFTFKGYSAREGCKLLKPKSIRDCALIGGLWRPSCLELGLEQVFLERRKTRWKIPSDWHPALHSLQPTFGIPVFQEQVIVVMRGLGFSPDEVMTMLKAVKKKDPVIMGRVKERLYAIVDAQVADQVWGLMEGYTRYGFGLSHAVTYGIFGYRMAYLKAHHPLEFSCALLRVETGTPLEQRKYQREARRLGFRLLPVDVTASQIDCAVEKGKLRLGLVSVTGVAEKGAEALIRARPFASLAEVRQGVQGSACNRGVLLKLAEAKAFRSLGFEDSHEVTTELDRLDSEEKADLKMQAQAERERKSAERAAERERVKREKAEIKARLKELK